MAMTKHTAPEGVCVGWSNMFLINTDVDRKTISMQNRMIPSYGATNYIFNKFFPKEKILIYNNESCLIRGVC